LTSTGRIEKSHYCARFHAVAEDAYTVLVVDAGRAALVYKRAIAAITPGGRLDLIRRSE